MNLIKERLKKEARLIEAYNQEYDVYRESVINRLVDEATESDWKEFVNYAKRVSYIKGRLFKEGVLDKNNKDTHFWFRVYISDEKLPHRDRDFIAWVSREKGYFLQQTKEGSFKIAGKQNSLF